MLPIPVLQTTLGRLYQGDCLEVLAKVPSESVDLAFADPPFNLNKIYSSLIDDNLAAKAYLEWCKKWQPARRIRDASTVEFLFRIFKYTENETI